MLLNELTGIKHLKDKTPKELIDYLENMHNDGKTKLGFLGNGVNGVAFTDGKTVFKFWHRDSGYEDFIKYCQENQGNKYLPKLYSGVKTLPFNIVSSYRNKRVSGVKFIRMELLDELDTMPMMKLYKDDDLQVSLSDILYASHSDEESMDSMLKRLIDSYTTYTGKHAEFKPDSVTDDITLLLKTLRGINSLAVGDNFIDMGGNNIMRRGDTIVFVDPLANSTDLDLGIDLFGE